jgi:outer membrane protein OmpA-like peptidoglycan-associated protein
MRREGRLPRACRAVRQASLLAALSGACAATGAPPASSLPLRQVVLYSNGLGTFERAGRLPSGHFSVRLRALEVVDVMKTLAVVSRDGRAASGSAASLKRLDEAGRMELDLTVPADREVTVSYAAPSPPWRAVYKLMLDGAGHGALETWAAINNESDEEWRDVRLTLAMAAPFSNRVDLQAAQCAAPTDATKGSARPPLGGFVAPERAGPDRDHDRIPDAFDACPDDPEVYNGFEDEDGCPDRGYSGTGHPSPISGLIHFPTETSQIAPVDKAPLDAIAATLQANPDIKLVEVQGHAADDERNPLGVAVERAAAVRRALLARGVGRERLRIRSYGATRPVCSSSGENCRSLNRRVELLTLEPVPRSGSSDAATPIPSKAGAAIPTASPTPHRETATTRYELGAPVTVPYRSSATVAIGSARVNATEVHFFRPDPNVPGSGATLYRAVRFETPAGAGLEGGPLTIYAGGVYVGDTVVDRLQPGEVTLLPFALDAATKVVVTREASSEPAGLVKIARGVFTVEDRQLLRTRYDVAVQTSPAAPIYLRHERRAGYEITRPPRGSEPAGGADIVPVNPGPDGRAALTIEESRTVRREITLTEEPEFDLERYVHGAAALTAPLTDRLRLLQALHAAAEHLDSAQDLLRLQVDDRTQHLSELRDNLEMIRKNARAAGLRKRVADELAATTRKRDDLAQKAAEVIDERDRKRAELRAQLEDLVYDRPAP